MENWRHGSVPIQMEADCLFSCLNFDNEEDRGKAKSSFASRETSLAEILDYQPEFHELTEILIRSLASEFGVLMTRQELADTELAEAEELLVTKYSTDDWNMRRSS